VYKHRFELRKHRFELHKHGFEPEVYTTTDTNGKSRDPDNTKSRQLDKSHKAHHLEDIIVVHVL
jgi:hypothetical protein